MLGVEPAVIEMPSFVSRTNANHREPLPLGSPGSLTAGDDVSIRKRARAGADLGAKNAISVRFISSTSRATPSAGSRKSRFRRWRLQGTP